jgi:pilus assembly protein CpaB
LSRRTGIILALVGIALALIGGIFVGSLFFRGRAAAPTPTPPPPLTELVVVVTHDIALGSVLSEADMHEVEIPLGLAPRGALIEISEGVGRMIKQDIVNGEIVMSQHLADPTNIHRDLAFILQDNEVLMAFPVVDLMGQLEMLGRGDRVDILVTIEQEVQPVEEGVTLAFETPEPVVKKFTLDAMQRLEITATIVEITSSDQGGNQGAPTVNEQGTPVPTPTPSPAQRNTVALLLALDPQDALVLKHLKDTSAIFDFVLRSPTSNQLFELEPVTEDYLIDLFGLEDEQQP